ncbi:MAG: hypothetical protein K1X66_08280 [Verrucomicrobiae bacterium]|nr:hypothetical protein [Verrucomicrobiae bacterium]
MSHYFKALFFLAWMGLYFRGNAQILITNLAEPYTQNFDSLGNRDVNPWINNKTLPGWYYVMAENRAKTKTPRFIAASDGSLATPFPYHFGKRDSSDRALGSIAGNVLGDQEEHFFGVYFINRTSKTITSVTISYTGEQWRDNDTQKTFLQCYYRVGSEDFTADTENMGWSYGYDYLGFTGPQSVKGGSIDGNDPANQVSVYYQIQNLKIPPGESFWIRWFDRDDEGINDHGLAIDDLTVSFSEMRISDH